MGGQIVSVVLGLNDAILPVREYGQTIAVNKLHSDTFVCIEQGVAHRTMIMMAMIM